ncbi:WD repeat protein [Tritrichomonas foetus]|uniref:WD repeat protein n=1 Tax=Tritrichomonas foetus TaxID=1144522 RepID=A0A1J4KGD3_9EUKA|nr:WD repeat protein [Tritrichomonas foetus]|eukprot:OHT08710.1 WD repeat protein [Tritrichomonas foetus]
MLNLNKDPQWAVVEEEHKVLCVQMSPDSQYVAAALSNGTLTLRSPTTGRLSYTLIHNSQRYAVTAAKFNPTDPKVLFSVAADGSIKEWTTKDPHSVWTTTEKGNQICAIDVSKDGTKFFTAGSDTHFRIYDYEEKKVIADLVRNEFDLETTRGHANRIMAIHCHHSDQNLIFTGGWDNTLQVWDIRQSYPVRSLFGPHVVGDSIDTCENWLMAGSWRTKDQFMIWDMRTFQLQATMQWGLIPEEQQGSIFAAKFHPNGQFIIAAGSGANQVKIYSTENYAPVGSPLQMKSPVLCMCMDPMADSVIVGTTNGDICFHNFVSSI